MLRRAARRAAALGLQPRVRQADAARPGFADASFDTVVFTLALCTIADPGAALAQARRMLRPGGTLLVLEHVRAPQPDLARWQDRLTPLWAALSGGCHLNRDTRAATEEAGSPSTGCRKPTTRGPATA
jgi:ubiquinone/menaquinone biosynthesis C-methylase UbiE